MSKANSDTQMFPFLKHFSYWGKQKTLGAKCLIKSPAQDYLKGKGKIKTWIFKEAAGTDSDDWKPHPLWNILSDIIQRPLKTQRYFGIQKTLPWYS